MNSAVYPGSFDPITLGHLNIIKRASKVFVKIYVCVLNNSAKKPLFTLEERLDFIKRSVKRFENVEVMYYDGLAVEFARERCAKVIVKGLRAVTDYDWEVQMALANKKIHPDIDTLFFASSEKYAYLSSTVVKEMAKYNADLSEFVPREVINDIVQIIQNRR